MRTRNTSFRENYLWQFVCCLFVTCTFGSGAQAAEPFFFRLGTGGETGTYFPIGMLIAESISDQRILGIAQLSNGSLTNVEDLHGGFLEGALVQADVAHWARTGTGPFESDAPLTNLSSVATLFPEALHLVARVGSGIHSIDDLDGRRVGLDEPGSGTLIDVLLVLEAFDLSLDSIVATYLKPDFAIDRLLQGNLDAFFIIAGHPIQAINDLTRQNEAELIAIDGPEVDQLVSRATFLSKTVLAANSYRGQSTDIATLAVGAQFLVRADLDEEIVYLVTERLWRPGNLQRLANGHPKGNQIRLDTALIGLSAPLHPGAARYYRKVGVEIPAAALLPDHFPTNTKPIR